MMNSTASNLNGYGSILSALLDCAPVNVVQSPYAKQVGNPAQSRGHHDTPSLDVPTSWAQFQVLCSDLSSNSEVVTQSIDPPCVKEDENDGSRFSDGSHIVTENLGDWESRDTSSWTGSFGARPVPADKVCLPCPSDLRATRTVRLGDRHLLLLGESDGIQDPSGVLRNLTIAYRGYDCWEPIICTEAHTPLNIPFQRATTGEP